MNCNCEQNAIVIVRNNDTDWNGANFLTINLETEILDLSDFKAVLNMSGVIKTFNDLSSGSIEVNLSAKETKNLPPFFNGVLNLIDSTNKVATIESLIPFKVISQVHGNAIATEPYTLNFDVKQGGETILTVNVESAITVKVGTTTTLPAGSDATITNVGTLNHLVLDFGIPQGIQGEQGETGADGQNATITGATATVNNQVGTPSVTVTSGGTEFARSFNFDFKNLKGEQGIQGIQGIQGVPGQDGADGKDGTNATITGATASVSNTVGIPNVVVTAGGTESARSFNFAFTNLKGDKGDTGAGMVATVVSELPITGETGKLYLVPKTTPAQEDIYDEYIWALVSSNPDVYDWEHIGSTDIDLTGYVQSVNNQTPDSNGNVSLTIPTVNDATLTVTQNGTSAGTFTANASSNTTIALTDTTYTDGTGLKLNGTEFNLLQEDYGVNPIPTVVGTLTNADGVYSGFSDSNYLLLPSSLSISATDDVEFQIKIKTPNTYSNTDPKYLFYFGSNFYAYVKNGNWAMNQLKILSTGSIFNTSLTTNTTFWLRFKREITSTGYTITTSYSTDGINFTESSSSSTSTPSALTSPASYIGRGSSSGEYFASGYIDINNTYLKINGEYWWNPSASTYKPCAKATTSLYGLVKPDGTSITVNDGVISSNITSSDVTTALGYTPEQSMTIQTLSATDSITLADNTIYNGGEQTALTITLPSTADVSFLCEIDFTSGTTATTLSYPNTIKWVGDDVNNNVFLPVASKRYTIICAYDGVNYRFTVKGVE